MRKESIQLLDLNNLIIDYRNENERMMKYFDYAPWGDEEKRLADLKERTFNRKGLTEVLTQTNEDWDASPETLANIQKLMDEDSVAVVGGQQVGLLSGPLYTVHKMISLIKYAEQKEKELNVPVVPIFWMAGEDHDYDEINHIYLLNDGRLNKHTLPHPNHKKTSMSHLEIDHAMAQKWLHEVFSGLVETEHTKTLYKEVAECLQQATTYVDFFARFIHKLFRHTGIILLDSGHDAIRKLQSELFLKLIKHQSDISEHVYETNTRLAQDGYPIMLDIERNDGHLFYHFNGERVLLKTDSDGIWFGKQNEIALSTQDIQTIAETEPEKLSNNVVTRPLMQELLLPTLAFIGGNGEIGYWAALKQSFHALQLKMPPVVPRLSLTLMTPSMEKRVQRHHLSMEDIINNGIEHIKQQWLAVQQQPPISEMADQLKRSIARAHEPFKNVAVQIRSDLESMSEKNLSYIHHQIDFLANRMKRAIEDKYHATINTFDQLGYALRPHQGLQERTWNILPFLNAYGLMIIRDLLEIDYSFQSVHDVVFVT